MAPKSGFAAQCMIAAETTWGVPVTPTLGIPMVTEGLGVKVDRLESKAIRTGRRVLDSLQWSPGNRIASGPLGLELDDRSTSLLFNHMFGTVVTTGAGPFTHTHTPGDLTGKGLTVQIGRPNVTDGTVHPFTYAGCKVNKWEMACKANEIVTLGLDLVARQEIRLRTVADGVTTNAQPTVTSATAAFTQDDLFKPISGAGIPANSFIGIVNSATSIGLSSSNTTNTPVNATAGAAGVTLTLGIALAAQAYASSLAPITFVSGAVTLAGSTYKVRSLKLAGDNKLDDKRIFVGSDLIDEPLEGAAPQREYTGSLDSEFIDLVAYRRFVEGTEAALVLHLARGASTVDITTNVRFDGETPKVAGAGIVGQMLPFKCLGSTDAAAVTAVLVNTDATP